MTSPYGPGAIWAGINGELETDFNLGTSIFFNYLNKNTLADLASTPYERADEVMAAAPCINQFETGVKLNYKLFGFSEVYIIPVVLHRFTGSSTGSLTDQISWYEFTVGGKLSANDFF